MTARLRALWMRFLGLLRTHPSEGEFEAELTSHIAMHTDDGIRAGLSPEQARRQALIYLGGVEQTKQAHRDARSLLWMEQIMQDLRYGLRTLGRSPGFTATVVITLALGIGACTSIFSLVNAVLLRSLPYGDPSRLIYLFTPDPHLSIPDEVISPGYADFFDIKQQNHSFVDMTTYEQALLKLFSQGAITRVGAARVDERFFATLQAQPELGRAIGAGDNQPGHDKVAVISHYLWQTMFAEHANVLEANLVLNNAPYKIIGVMPPGFAYPSNADLLYGDPSIPATNIWIPLALTPQQKAQRDVGNNFVLARLREGVSKDEAQAEMSTLIARLRTLHAGLELSNFNALVKNFLQNPIGSVRPLMWLLLGAVGMVLLIACGNAANLLLARNDYRMREIGMRVALGAGRNRIVRQLLTESLLLGVAAGAAGIGLTWIFLQVLPLLNPGSIPRLDQASLDLRVLLFCLLISFVTSVLAGMLPAWTISPANLKLSFGLGNGQGIPLTHTRWQSLLIVAEAALVVVLLSGAGLFIRSYLNVASIHTGFSESTLKANISLEEDEQQPEGVRAATFDSLINSLSSIPGLDAVGAINFLPLGKGESVSFFSVDGFANRKDQLAEGRTVTPQYFSAMGTPLISGRYFRDEDAAPRPGHPVIVNQQFARLYFADRSAIGGRLREDDTKVWNTVVGVVADVRHTSLEEEVQPQIYHASYDFAHATLVVRSSLPPSTVAAAMRAKLRAVNPLVVLDDFGAMGDLVSQASAGRRFQTSLLTVFAAIALFLAVVGLYGLMAYTVSRRTREVGIRMALGAQRADVLRLVLKKALALLAIGLVAGLVASWFATRAIQAFLFGVGRHDLMTTLSVCALLVILGLLAALIPARRAASIDPMQALRTE